MARGPDWLEGRTGPQGKDDQAGINWSGIEVEEPRGQICSPFSMKVAVGHRVSLATG